MSNTNHLTALLKSAKKSLIVYSTLTDPSYRPNRFHRYLARRLEAAVERGHGRIIIQAPPQHGKSTLISRKLPAWILGRDPEKPIISASYGDALVTYNGSCVRDIINSEAHKRIFPKSEIAAGPKDDFYLTEGGHYLGITIRGGGTGFGAKYFIIDDPIKNRMEAESYTFRKHLQEWYQSVVYTRLTENAVLIIMHTRWHEDDLAGWLQTEHAQEKWEVINLPALAEDDDILERAYGEALVPQRFSEEALHKIRVAIGPRDWSALYQGRPQPKGGSVFRKEWIRHYDATHIMKAVWSMNRYIIIDPARTQKRNSDHTAMGVIGLHVDGNYYLLDAVYDRLTLRQRAEALLELHRKWRPLAVGYKKTGHEQDIEYVEELQNRENYRFPVISLSESGSKEGRIERLAPDFEENRFWLPPTLWKTNAEGTPVEVIEKFVEEEYKTFPAGKHDDFLDMLSGIKDISVKWPRVTSVTPRQHQKILII